MGSDEHELGKDWAATSARGRPVVLRREVRLQKLAERTQASAWIAGSREECGTYVPEKSDAAETLVE